jgi:hypothetical protein
LGSGLGVLRPTPVGIRGPGRPVRRRRGFDWTPATNPFPNGAHTRLEALAGGKNPTPFPHHESREPTLGSKGGANDRNSSLFPNRAHTKKRREGEPMERFDSPLQSGAFSPALTPTGISQKSLSKSGQTLLRSIEHPPARGHHAQIHAGSALAGWDAGAEYTHATGHAAGAVAPIDWTRDLAAFGRSRTRRHRHGRQRSRQHGSPQNRGHRQGVLEPSFSHGPIPSTPPENASSVLLDFRHRSSARSPGGGCSR